MGIFGRFNMVFFTDGTVAWFSSTRTFSMQAGDFEIAQIDGNLDCTVTAGIGTIVTGSKAEGNQAIEIASAHGADDHRLLDGSVNHATGKPYRLNRDTTGDADHYKEFSLPSVAEPDWEVKSITTTTPAKTTHYFVAVSWTLTFSYTFNSETKPVGVYFNYNSSTMTATQVTAAVGDGNGNKSQEGFRIAFIPATTVSSSNRALVWGFNTAYGSGHYVNGVASSNVGTYSGNYAYPAETYTAAVDGTDAASDTANRARKERICTLVPSTQESMAVTCIAWFEGEDDNVVNDTEMDKMKAKLNFYARSDFAAFA